jgi:AcrR family transcriptional regulator
MRKTPPRGRPRSFDRDAALKSAMMVFWAKGYDGASLPELTEAMGIHSPSLYAAFRSKQELYREALDLYGETEGSGIWESIPEAPTARAAVKQFLHVSADAFTRRNRPGGCMIALGELQATAANEAVRRDLRRRRARGVAILRRRLQRAVSARELPASADCLAVARFYATVQHGMSIQARDGASRETLRAIADSAMMAWDAVTRRAR